MNNNICALQKACTDLDLPYEFTHKTKNVLMVTINSRPYIFANWVAPLNDQSMDLLCKDKDFFYTFYKDVIRMPKSFSFLDPHTDEQYEQYLDVSNYDDLIDDIESKLNYSLIVKKNRGSFGRNVFKVEDTKELQAKIATIYDHDSNHYDYILIAQEYIAPQNEYRALFLDGKLEFAYEKDIENATFRGNLSPLHWENARAVKVVDEHILDKLQQFAAPLFEKMMIPYCGLDIIESTDGELCLIETNASPGFDKFISDEGIETVVQWYKKVLLRLKNAQSRPNSN